MWRGIGGVDIFTNSMMLKMTESPRFLVTIAVCSGHLDLVVQGRIVNN